MKLALVVGVDHYKNAPLSGCVNDAKEVARALSVNWDRSPNFQTRLVSSDCEAISRSRLRSHLTQLWSAPAQLSVFYFSGHGYLNDLGGYLVTQDASSFDEGISMSDLLAMANLSQSQEVVIILDCCHSGALGSIPSLPKDTSLLRQGVSILCASRSSEAAIEANGHGLFTSLLCEALYGGAASLLGEVTAADVFAFVTRTMGPWDQRPLFKCNVMQMTSLRRCNPRLDVSTLRRITEIFPDSESLISLDPSYEAMPTEEEAMQRQAIFDILRSYRAAGLVEPHGASDMFVAAMNSRDCRLTKLGKYYRLLVSQKRI